MKINHKPLDKVMAAWAESIRNSKKVRIYAYEELFEADPQNPDDILFKIPDDAITEFGWKEGDVVDITADNGCLTIKRQNVVKNQQTA
jgi:hypothetical protein